MVQIFVSYANPDRPRVETLVRALHQRGWKIWWDRSIIPGRAFDEVIEQALDASECLIVVWSKDSVRSQWVKTEAAEGVRRGILVPVLFDDVTMPLEFRRIQAARLVDWDGRLDHPDFERLVEAVETITGVSHQEASATPARASLAWVWPVLQSATGLLLERPVTAE